MTIIPREKKTTPTEKKRMEGTVTEWQISTNSRLFLETSSDLKFRSISRQRAVQVYYAIRYKNVCYGSFLRLSLGKKDFKVSCLLVFRLFGNQVNRKSGTCEFRRSSRMVTCQRGFWDIWNTDNKKTRSGIWTLSYTHNLPYLYSDNYIWLSVYIAISLFR